MIREEAAAIVARRFEAFARRDLDALADLYSEESVLDSMVAGSVTGRQAIRVVYESWFRAFPDCGSTVEEILVDGDRVVQTGVLTGTDMGGFMGLPPTGKPFRLPIVYLFTVRQMGIVHERRVYDFTGLLVQIGVLKAKPG